MLEVLTVDGASGLAAMEANLVGHMAYLPSLLPGTTVINGPGLTLVDAGMGSDTFNVVCGAKLDGHDAEAAVRVGGTGVATAGSG